MLYVVFQTIRIMNIAYKPFSLGLNVLANTLNSEALFEWVFGFLDFPWLLTQRYEREWIQN